MRVLSALLTTLTLSVVLIGCSVSPGQYTGGYLSEEEVLKIDPTAEVFVCEDKVYKTGIDWVEKEDLTKSDQVEIINEETASHLPSDAKIFKVKEREDILIVEVDGTEKRYLLQLGE